MRFVFHGLDHPGAGDLRARHRAAHRDYHDGRGNPVGGPLLDPEGDPCGTLIVLEAEDADAAARVMAQDPYVVAGLFAHTSLLPFRAIDWPVDDRRDGS